MFYLTFSSARRKAFTENGRSYNGFNLEIKLLISFNINNLLHEIRTAFSLSISTTKKSSTIIGEMGLIRKSSSAHFFSTGSRTAIEIEMLKIFFQPCVKDIISSIMSKSVNVNEATEAELLEIDNFAGRMIFEERKNGPFMDLFNLKCRVRAFADIHLASFAGNLREDDLTFDIKTQQKTKSKSSKKSARPKRVANVISEDHVFNFGDPNAKKITRTPEESEEFFEKLAEQGRKKLREEYPDGIPEEILRASKQMPLTLLPSVFSQEYKSKGSSSLN